MDKEEVIRRGFETVMRGDPAAGAALLAPDARWHSAIGVIMGRTEYVGHEEIVQLVFHDIPSVLEDFRPEVVEVRDLGGDMALAVVRWRATVRSSGLQVDQVFGQLCQVREGRWREMRSYERVDLALAAIPEVRLRHGYDDWNRGDLDGAVNGLHADVVLEQDPSIPGAETVRGRAAVREWLGRFMDAWEDFELEPERIETLGERVVAVLRLRATARSSRIPVDERIAHVFRHDEDGLVRRWRTYTDPDKAVEE